MHSSMVECVSNRLGSCETLYTRGFPFHVFLMRFVEKRIRCMLKVSSRDYIVYVKDQ